MDRSDIFITTKLWIKDYGYDEALKAADTSLRKLGTDYIDLYLLHQPVPMHFDRTIAAYKAAEKLLADMGVELRYHIGYHPNGSYSYVDAKEQLGLELSVNNQADYRELMERFLSSAAAPFDELK